MRRDTIERIDQLERTVGTFADAVRLKYGRRERGVGRKGEFSVEGFDGAKLPEELQIQSDHVYIASKMLGCDPRSLKRISTVASVSKEKKEGVTIGINDNKSAIVPTTMMFCFLIILFFYNGIHTSEYKRVESLSPENICVVRNFIQKV